MSLLQPNSPETQSSFSSPPFPSFNDSSFTAFGDIYSGGSATDFHRFPLNPRRGYPSLPKVFNDEINGQTRCKDVEQKAISGGFAKKQRYNNVNSGAEYYPRYHCFFSILW